MESYLFTDHYDLVTPDGLIASLSKTSPSSLEVLVAIYNISPAFAGYKIDREFVFFNVKSTLAQLGIDAVGREYQLDPKTHSALVKVHLYAIGDLAQAMLDLLTPGCFIGKLFAADPRRKVTHPDLLTRMFGRADSTGSPLLSLGGLQGDNNLVLEKIDGRIVAFLPLQEGALRYDPSVRGFLPTLAKALRYTEMPTRAMLQLHQVWEPGFPCQVKENEILLVRTLPLHVRTVFGKVVDSLLPRGYRHTTAAVLEPDTKASGDVYELFGSSDKTVTDIPLEFYTLEPHREHVFFADRDQLQAALDNSDILFKTFDTAPSGEHTHAAVFVVKSDQLLSLSPKDWIARTVHPADLPGLIHPGRQMQMVENYIRQQPSYPFLKSIEDGLITSEGVLFVRYFPTPLLKKMLLSEPVQKHLKRIYFQIPSMTYGEFFSHEDRSMLLDLAKYAIPVFWVDKTSGKILQYVPKPNKDSGMFVPLPLVDTFLKATLFGIYGSNLMEGNFEEQLKKLLEGVQEMRPQMTHPLLNPNIPIALVTGGGPGAMGLGNRVAKSLNILSCANIADFHIMRHLAPNESLTNPYIDAKMTYRLDRLIERQDEFNLDFPIFLMGGIGTDFEFALEEVRRKTGSTPATPVLLFGDPDYWRKKITSRFQVNLATGTIAGSEWISNSFYCIQNAAQGIKVYRQFLTNILPIGPSGPIHKDGFAIVS